MHFFAFSFLLDVYLFLEIKVVLGYIEFGVKFALIFALDCLFPSSGVPDLLIFDTRCVCVIIRGVIPSICSSSHRCS